MPSRGQGMPRSRGHARGACPVRKRDDQEVMQIHNTTPFGRRPLSLAMVASQAATKEFAESPGASDRAVHKWRLFRALTEARGRSACPKRALSVLQALLSFHQETRR